MEDRIIMWLGISIITLIIGFTFGVVITSEQEQKCKRLGILIEELEQENQDYRYIWIEQVNVTLVRCNAQEHCVQIKPFGRNIDPKTEWKESGYLYDKETTTKK